MAGAKQSKRVSWAPGLNLCQVRLFLSEDAPSQSGLGSQDHLQAKPAWLLHSTPPASDDSVPPGFETMHRGQIQRNIPLIKWQCPPNQWLKPEWLVVAGEESQEIASQDRRQIGVLEAVYPRLSSIPPDPSVSSDVQQAPFDDSQAVLIPIVAVEDDDAAELDSAAPTTTVSISSSSFIPPSITAAPELSLPASIPPIPNLPPAQLLPVSASSIPLPGASVKPDIAAAASAAFTAIMRSNEEGSLIDRDLLIKLLRDPTMVEKLVSEYSARKHTTLPTTQLQPQPQPQSQSAPPPPSGSTNTAHPMPLLIKPPAAIPTKDANYYKSLIQKHGGDRQEAIQPAPPAFEIRRKYHQENPSGSAYGDGVGREMRGSDGRKARIEKPCAFFNTPRGCREGSSCSYRHDLSAMSKKIERERGTKRLRFDR